jgi:hypothetical protein
MTRAEDDAIKRAYQHADYIKRREAKLAYAKQYAIDNRDKINRQQRERRQRYRDGAVRTTQYRPPSTSALEAALPVGLAVQRLRLREEYLSIHITERPPYDHFLRCKTIEYLIQRNYERKRNEQHPTTGIT